MRILIRDGISADLDLGTVRPGTYELVKCMGRGEAKNSKPEAAYLLDNLTVSVMRIEQNIANGNAEYINDEQKPEGVKMTTLPVISSMDVVTPYADPKKEVDRAHQMAKVLQDVVKQAGLSRKFGGQKEHLFFEAWQTIGRFFNVTPSTEWSKPLMAGDKIIGWEARAIVTNANGQVVAAAESMCAGDEPNWKGKAQYAIRSMAQTRASSKALRQAFAWVAVLAGYSATPAEEMDAEFTKGVATPPAAPKAETSAPPPAKDAPADAATEKQRKMLWAKGMTRWNDKQKATDFMTWLKEMAGAEYFTKKYASECIEDFEARAGDFESDGISKSNDEFPT